MALCGISLMSIKPVVFAQNCVFLNSGISRARFQHVHKISNAAVAHRERPRRLESSKRCNFCQPGGRAGNGLCNGDSETQISQRLTSPTPRPSGAWPGFPHLRRNPGARGAVTGWLYLSVRQRIVSAWSSNGGLHSARSLENDPNPLEMQHSRLRRLHLASLPIVLFSKETKTTSACEGNVTATNCPKHCKTRVFLPEYAFSTAWTCTWRPQF